MYVSKVSLGRDTKNTNCSLIKTTPLLLTLVGDPDECKEKGGGFNQTVPIVNSINFSTRHIFILTSSVSFLCRFVRGKNHNYLKSSGRDMPIRWVTLISQHVHNILQQEGRHVKFIQLTLLHVYNDKVTCWPKNMIFCIVCLHESRNASNDLLSWDAFESIQN